MPYLLKPLSTPHRSGAFQKSILCKCIYYFWFLNNRLPSLLCDHKNNIPVTMIFLSFRFLIFQCVLHALHTFLLHLYRLAATYMISLLSLIHLSALTPRYKSWNCISFIKSIMHWQIHLKQWPSTSEQAVLRERLLL